MPGFVSLLSLLLGHTGIYEFDAENKQWITRPEVLSAPRFDHSGVMVSSLLLDCRYGRESRVYFFSDTKFVVR